MRDRALGSTIRLFFNSTNPDAGGAPVAPSTAFVAADIRIYKDGSATEKASAAGVTITSPFDSIVGLHLVEIDTSNNTDAGFWSSGSAYSVRLVTATTVATYSVSGLLIGEISLELQTATLAAKTHTGAVIPTVSTVTDGAKSATALSTATWTGTLATNIGTTNTTVAANLDATVSSRSTYAGGPVASVTAAVELDSATRVKLDASQPDYAPVKIDQVTSGTIDPATRSIDDTTPLRFAWPTSGETITVERSINSGAFAAADGAVTFFRTEGTEHWYLLAYDADDRAVGVVRYRLTDGDITRYMTLQVSEQSPVTLDSATRVKLDANQPDYAPALAATALSTTQWTNTLATNLGTTNTTVATNLDVTVSSRSTQTSVDTIDDLLDTEMPALTAAVAAEAVKTSAIKTKTDNLPTDPADQSLLEAAITAATSPLATPAQVNAQVLDVLSVDTFGELSSPPAATSSLKDKLVWLFMWARNKATATATERKLFADDVTTVVSTETITDDGTTFTKGEAS